MIGTLQHGQGAVHHLYALRGYRPQGSMVLLPVARRAETDLGPEADAGIGRQRAGEVYDS
jgi:hypothetical protein